MLILKSSEFEEFKITDILPKKFKIFDDKILIFLNDLSNKILKNKLSRNFPDLITFGFFCRKSNLLKLKDSYRDELSTRFGCGLALHIAPSNIPINFAFSFVFGILAGNTNFVRLPSNSFAQCELFLKIISDEELTKKHDEVLKTLVFFRSLHSSIKLNELISKIDVLVVWGGDQTVTHFKYLNKNISCRELYFPNKVSSLLIDSNSFIEHDKKTDLMKAFYNDTYLVDQNACSSPTNIFWLGNKKSSVSAQKLFLEELSLYLESFKDIGSTNIIDKHLAIMKSLEIHQESIRLKKYSNRIWYSSDLKINPENYRLGIFNFINIGSIRSIQKYLRSNEQTLTYFGLEKENIKLELENNNIIIDRVVPIGSALDLNIIWDGIDILRHISKRISYQ